jgi:uncharacterized protein involved in exopolysaccharide biosynthesis
MTLRERDLEAEQEVDLGRYAAAVAARWWLPALGLMLGVALGWLLAVGGEQVYVARAVVYLGQPFAPNSTAPVPGLTTNPRTVREIVTSTATVRRVAREVGTTPAKLRAGLTVQAVTEGAPARAAQNPLVAVSVRADEAAEAREAAQLLAERVVDEVGDYANDKIATLEREIDDGRRTIRSLDQRIEAARSLAQRGGADSTDRLVALMLIGSLEGQRAAATEDLAVDQQLLALAEDVERPRVLDEAAAQRTTARSKRNSLVVAGTLGLLAGLIAALVWDWAGRRVGRSRAG